MNRIKSYITYLRFRGARLAMAATLAATAIATVASSGTAYADYCTNNGLACLNAWNGGPFVKVESPGAANNYFTLLHNNGYYQIQYLNLGRYSGDCIGDYNNSPGDARAGLVSCSNPVGWGVNFNQNLADGCNGFVFNNVHESAYLGPQTAVIGAQFYLNKPTSWCFTAR